MGAFLTVLFQPLTSEGVNVPLPGVYAWRAPEMLRGVLLGPDGRAIPYPDIVAGTNPRESDFHERGGFG